MRSSVGRESADRHGERTDAVGPQWPGQGVSVDFAEALPADGGARGTEHPGDDFRQKESCARVLPVLAQVKDPQDGWTV